MTAFKNLGGKRVLITGAAAGIGYELALAFADEKADIIATDIQVDGLERLAALLEQRGGSVRHFPLDVTDERAFDALFSRLSAEAAFPDIVVNNAGIGYMASFGDTDGAAWRRVLDINVLGVANGCRSFLNARGPGSGPALIINLASAASISPMPNMSAYAASKYAVEGLSEVLALELAESSVDVICVHPGVINTAIVDHPERVKMPRAQLERLQGYYKANGAPPATVARDVAAAVKSGRGSVYTGDKVFLTTLCKRFLSRRRYRKLLLSSAREIGYL